jgi:Flp pilus assembly protein TadD
MITLLGAGALAFGQAQPNQELDGMKRSFFVSGRVVLDDGTPPNQRVAIESVCPTRTRSEAYTDLNGAFRFNLGGEGDVQQDASVSNSFEGYHAPGSVANSPSAIPATATGVQGGSMSQREAMQCFLRASLAGFHSNTVALGTLQMTGITAVPTIVLRRMQKPDKQRVSVTTLQAPPEAKKAYDHARQNIAKGQSLDAIEDLRKAIQLHPHFAEALVQLGEIYAQQGLRDEAERLFSESLAADPKFSPAYFDLAPIVGERADWTRMAELTDQGLALDGFQYAAGYYFNALAYYRLGDLAKAEKSARAARNLDPSHSVPNVELILASILVRHNDPAGAAEQLRTFLKFSPKSSDALRARDMLSKLESKRAQE